MWGFVQCELLWDARGKCPRFQQAILRLVEFLVGNTSLALDPLKIGDLVRLARNFDRRGCRILRRHQQGRAQADQETDRNRAEEDRKSVVLGKSVSVRVDIGGPRHIKKKNEKYTLPTIAPWTE